MHPPLYTNVASQDLEYYAYPPYKNFICGILQVRAGEVQRDPAENLGGVLILEGLRVRLFMYTHLPTVPILK